MGAREKVALVGPNGTGKSTLLRQVWEGENPAIQVGAGVRVGYFSQLRDNPFADVETVEEELYGFGFANRNEMEEYLRRYCLGSDILNRSASQLSGGEQNLLQLAKLAVKDTGLLLLDEPSSHLDTYAQMALEKAIKAYGGAVLMVSHDYYTVANCADRILYVENHTIRSMSGRAFRKRIYKNHFSAEYLQLELRKRELEERISRCLAGGDLESAQLLCRELGTVVEQMASDN